MQSKEVQQHLDIQSHADVGQIKLLFAGLVVHYPQEKLVVPDPAVHAVHLAAHPQLAVRLRDGNRRQSSVLPAEGQLKSHGNEVGVPQFLRHLINDRIGRVPQPPEQVLEPGVPILEIVQLLRRILVDILPYKAMQPVIVHSGKAPLRQHVPRHVFQQIVQERTDLRRVKGRRFPRLRPQAVFHEIGKMAGADPFHPGRGHGDPPAVNSPDGGRRQAPRRGCPRLRG